MSAEECARLIVRAMEKRQRLLITSSAMRFQDSTAGPLRSPPAIRPGSCSKRDQSLVFPPSIWWAEVATPQRKPAGHAGTGRARGGPGALQDLTTCPGSRPFWPPRR